MSQIYLKGSLVPLGLDIASHDSHVMRVCPREVTCKRLNCSKIFRSQADFTFTVCRWSSAGNASCSDIKLTHDTNQLSFLFTVHAGAMNIYKILFEDLQSTILHTTLCILAILLSLPVASVALPIWLVFILFQWAAATWILFWKMGQILATPDVPFAQESNPHNFITCLFTVNGKLSVRVLRKAFCTKIFQGTDESYLRLKKCLQCKMGRYIRQDEENFDIRKHIFVYKGPSPGNDVELAQCYNELINQKIPNHISPWQLIIIPRGKKFGAKTFAICVRIHHTIGDGFALVGLFTKVVDNKPILLKPSVKRPFMSKTRRILRAIFTGPLVLLCLMFSTVENPFPRRKDLSGQTKVAWTKPINLADIKRCKNKFGECVAR